MMITFVFAFFLFLIMGSTNSIETIISLNIYPNQLIVNNKSFLIYWHTIEKIFKKFFEYLLGENIYAILSLALSRVASFYILGIKIKLRELINIKISKSVSLIVLVKTAHCAIFFQRKTSN